MYGETDDGEAREAVVVIAPGQVLFSEIRGPLPMVLGKSAEVEMGPASSPLTGED